MTSDQQRPAVEPAASRQVAALDAIEEIACAPAQPSLLLELCVERARALVRAGGAAVQLLESAEPGELLFAATSGMLRDQLGTLNAVQGTLCGTALRRGEVVRSADATVDPRGDRAAARSLGLRSTVSLPLRQRQRAIGVLLVCSDRPDYFTDEDVTLLARLGRVASSRLDFALARDQRRRSEQALSASRQKYRTVLASVEQGILVVDEYDRVTMVNSAAERILGEPGYELMRRSPSWVLQQEDGAPLPRDQWPSSICLREQRVASADMLRIVRSRREDPLRQRDRVPAAAGRRRPAQRGGLLHRRQRRAGRGRAAAAQRAAAGRDPAAGPRRQLGVGGARAGRPAVLDRRDVPAGRPGAAVGDGHPAALAGRHPPVRPAAGGRRR